MSTTLIIADHRDRELKKSTLSAVAFAKQAGGFDIAVIGKHAGDVADQLTHFGAGTIYVVDEPALDHYLAHEYSTAVTDLIRKIGAEYVVMGESPVAREMMPQVACRLDAGMAGHVIQFQDGKFKREVYAGQLIELIEITTPIKVVTVSCTAFPAAGPESGDGSPVEHVSCDIQKGRVRLIDKVDIQLDRPELTEAEVVVSGGRGLKKPENKRLLEKFADKLGAAIGWSRAAVDSGWASNDLQVGQTGKTVAPSLYIAVGISGSVQHLAGMRESKTIVAINKDEAAPIFSNADYGIVGDLFKILPELTRKITTH